MGRVKVEALAVLTGLYVGITGHIHIPGVFENRVLRIFRPERDEVTGEWRKLHNEKLNDLYCSPNIVLVL